MEGRGYLELLRLPRVQSEGTHFGQVDPEAPATTAGQPGRQEEVRQDRAGLTCEFQSTRCTWSLPG